MTRFTSPMVTVHVWVTLLSHVCETSSARPPLPARGSSNDGRISFTRFRRRCTAPYSGMGYCMPAADCTTNNTVPAKRCRTNQVCCISSQARLRPKPKPVDEPFKQPVEDCGRRTVTLSQTQSQLPPTRPHIQTPYKSPANSGESSESSEKKDADSAEEAHARQVEDDRWPWNAMIGVLPTNSNQTLWICGGALISANYVLTAASCLSPLRQSNLTSRLVVRLGEHRISDSDDGPHQNLRVSRVIYYPLYRARHDNIALLRLAHSTTLTTPIAAVCLPKPRSQPAAELPAQLAGWSLPENYSNPASDQLQRAQLQLVDVHSCESKYSKTTTYKRKFPGGFLYGKLCAVGKRRRTLDLCIGDRGGPLVQLVGDRYQLIGIATTNTGCINPGYPGIYTQVSTYTAWIMHMISTE